jgi:hypothetical protein
MSSAGVSTEHMLSEISRIDVVCGPDVMETVLSLAMRWAHARAVSEVDRVRLAALVRAAVEHGLRFEPRGVSLVIGWQAPDRVRVDLRWHGSSGCASAAVADGGVGATIATLDAFADQWGFGGTGADPVHWMVVDTG